MCHRGWLYYCYYGAFLSKSYVTYGSVDFPNLVSAHSLLIQAGSQLLPLGQYWKPKDFVSDGFVLFGTSVLFCRPDLNLFYFCLS